jgi:hypothetical protein
MAQTSKAAKAALAKRVPWQVNAIAYLTLGLVVIGDALFAQEYLLLSLSWLLWYGLGAIGLTGAIYYLSKSDWRRVINQVPVELTLILALMIGSSFWSFYPSQTVTSFLLEISLVIVALFFVALFTWRQILNIFANTIRAIIFGTLSVELISALFKLVPASREDSSILNFLQSLGKLADGRTIDELLP